MFLGWQILEKIIIKRISRFYPRLQQVGKKYRKMLILFQFHSFFYHQISLNRLMNDHHFSYITNKPEKKQNSGARLIEEKKMEL